MASAPFDWVSESAGRALDGVKTIPIVATTTVAFIGRTERGPLNEPVAIDSFDAYQRTFGGYCPFSFLPQAVQHFFWHCGKAAIVVRVANRATRALLDVPAGADVLRLQARNPGGREFLRVSVDYDRLDDDSRRFNLVVQRLSRPGSHLVEDQELFSGVSLDPGAERYVIDALRDSDLVRVTGPLPAQRPEATRARRPGEPIPYLEMTSAGTDGEDLTDYDIIGSDRNGTGLFALDRCEAVDLVCIPSPPGRDLGITSFVAATRYCERRRALLVWDPPWSWYSADAAILSVRSTEQASHNVVTYFPRVRPRADLSRYPSGIPACGVVAGILASSDRHGVWHRLPLSDSGLKGNLVPLGDVSARQTAMLNRIGINTLVRAQAGGAALQGNVSFVGSRAMTGLWQRLDNRRLALFVVRSIERYTRWVFTAPAAPLRAALEAQITDFLACVLREGALPGNGPKQAFFVRVVPAASGAAGADRPPLPLTLRIGIALQRPNDFVVYEFHYAETATRVELVAPLDAARRHRSLESASDRA
jgi:hypothetical protein